MALDLGTLSAKVQLDDSGFQQGLRKLPGDAERAGQRSGEGVKRGMSPGLRSLGTLIAGLGIAQLTGSVLGFGFKTAMTMEKASISFTTLLGSGKKAQSFMTQLKNFAATTPFEFTELQGSASQLLASGISASKVIPIMKTLGNVTSGMGTGSEGIQRAVVALQQMNAAGKIQAEDLNQLRDAGIPVYDLLASATGKSKKEIAKLAQTGKLGGKELTAMMKALETGKGLERFNGLMDKQSQSLDGIISTVKDTVGQGLADAMAPMIPSIKEGLNAFTSALPGILGGIKEFGGWVVKNQGWLKYLAIGLGVAAGGFLAVSAAMAILNAIMALNPISIIILSIAALVAGLLWAYDNVAWFRDGVNAAFKVIGDIARWLWNNALAPTFRFIVIGTAGIILAIASMLDALSTVPGMEWAKGAASSLRDMGHAALDAANGIKAIPDPEVKTDDSKKKVKDLDKQIKGLKGKIVEAKAKGDTKEVERLQAKIKALKSKKVTLEANVKKTGISTISINQKSKGWKLSAYANGGPFLPGWALVGEQGPELVRFAGAGRVYTAGQTRKMLASQPQQPGRAGMTLNITNHYPQAEPTSITTNRALATAATLGGK